MKRILTCCLLIVVLAAKSMAQEQPTLQQQADKLYERFEYFKSISLYLKLVNKKKPNVKLLERVADCYRNINRYEEAEGWYVRAVADTNAANITHFNYAEVLLRGQKFDKAKEQYQLYFKKVNEPDLMALKLRTCDSAALWVRQPSGYTIKSVDNFNTAFSEWGLAYEGKTGLIFTSDRRLYYGPGDDRTGNNWFRLYHADLNGSNIIKLPVVSNETGQYINSYHVGPIALNATADTAYITIATEVAKNDIVIDKTGKRSAQKLYTRRLQLLVAAKRNNQWIEISAFPYNDINQYSIGHAALSTNGRLLYFTSDMPGGEGKTDIWYCEKQANGRWGKPVNCGKNINTKEEEAFPEIGGDNVLYYSSKGLPGMGGYDIYAAKGEKANWSEPVNLKYPVNSTSDDLTLITHDGLSGYFSSNRQNGKGDDDIYQFSYKKPEPILIKALKPPVADVPKTVMPAPVPQAVKAPEVYAVNNIYYDLDKSNIRPDAAVELNKLIELLKQHPAFKVDITSHTDSRAPSDYNIGLSQRRSTSVVAYLVKNGISRERLITSYYGETRLLNECADGVNCTEAEHQLNRRSEFKIIP